MKYLSDIIKEVVEASNTAVYFQFGNWRELCVDLADKAKSKNWEDQRYPLILLHNDFEELFDSDGRHVEVPSFEVFIITQSEPTLTTQDRHTSIYANILNPLYSTFISELKSHKLAIKNLRLIEHMKKDLYRLYVGDDKNRLPDHLDAIQVSFKNFKYIKKINC